MKKFDLVIVGVGGQGTLLASKILGHLALKEGCGVKVSEVHGMSQRGGSVITHVRVGDEVCSPIVAAGEADFLLSFEELEAARAASFLRKDGVAIVNTQVIWPMPVITGVAAYPQDIVDKLSQVTDVTAVDALALSLQAGSPKAVNVVLIGILAQSTNIDKETWIEVIKQTVPEKFLDLNLKAFELGYTYKG